MPLTDAKLRALKPAARPYKVSDSEGLHVLVTPTGSVLWRLADRIDALVQQIGAERDRIEQRPRREAELALKLENAQAAAVRLGLVLQDGVSTTLPSQVEVARLRELAGAGALARTRATDAHFRATRAVEEAAQADAAVANLAPPEGLEQARAAVAAGRRAGDLDAQVDAKRLLVTRATGKLTDALATLKPWTGTAEALQGVTLLTDAAIDAAAAEILEADRVAGDARRSLEERSRDLDAARARLANLSQAGDLAERAGGGAVAAAPDRCHG